MLAYVEKHQTKLNLLQKLSFLFIILAFASCEKEIAPSTRLVDYIPKNAQVVIKINDLEGAKRKLRDNNFIKSNSNLNLLSYFKNLSILDENSTVAGSLLCFSPIGKNDFEYTFISKFNPALIQKDSLATKKIEQINYAEKIIHKVTSGTDTFYATQKDSILVASSSQILIENVIRQQEKQVKIDTDLQKAYEVSGTENPFTILINGKKLNGIHNAILTEQELAGISNFSGWASVDINVEQNAIYFNGIAMEKDSLSSTIGVFDQTIAQENRLAAITPVTAKGFISYTYDDFDILKRNLALAQERQVADIPTDLDEVLTGVTELGLIYLDNETAFALTAIDPRHTENLLEGTVHSKYREIPIYNYDQKITFSGVLHPLLPKITTKYYVAYGEFIVFAESIKTLQTIISNILNKTLLSESDQYKNPTEKIAKESSILLVGSVNYLKEYIGTNANASYQEEWKNLAHKGYQHIILQFIKENDYAHIHGALQKNIIKSGSTSVTQVASTTLGSEILSPPILVKNHRTKGLDAAVQDLDNNLYLISDKGTIFWKKQINGAIMGDIKQIDIYKNGRYQLLFNTKSKVYLIDRDGKDVAPYPISLEEIATQPLALFDYDKTKRYRILVTQKDNIKMYDAKAKIVKGFKFNGTPTEIIQPPKHIRIGTKDHIMIPEQSGQLNILDRLGKTRVHIKDKIQFSENEWYLFQDRFTSTTSDGKLVQFDTKGGISTKALNLAKDHQIVATNKTLVTLSENKLTIKNRTVELESGVYTAPKLFYLNNKIYISVTDLQGKKVYLFDSNAELLPNFPVYGNSAISLGNMDKDANLEFVVKGEESGILIYQIN